jgi:GNAT superfamily N-acetyltransferase
VKIVTYRDLRSKDDLLPLMDHGFRWSFNPREFEEFVKLESWLRNGIVGLCALEGDHVVGFVGAYDLPTRTLGGSVEYAGGVYGVATLPSHTRKGISTALMNSLHQHFRDKGYRFSILGTSRILIAHAFYEKLGYRDFLEIPSAYKVFEKRRKPRPMAGEKPSKTDLDKLLKIYNEHDKPSLTVRDVSLLKAFKKAEEFTDKDCRTTDEGYVLFKKDHKGVWIRELVALNANEMNRLVSFVEEQAKDLVYDRAVLDSTLLEVYRSRGYMIHGKSHSVMMAKPLTPDASFKQTYGDRIYMAGLDFF